MSTAEDKLELIHEIARELRTPVLRAVEQDDYERGLDDGRDEAYRETAERLMGVLDA
jgi:hypothetical protein